MGVELIKIRASSLILDVKLDELTSGVSNREEETDLSPIGLKIDCTYHVHPFPDVFSVLFDLRPVLDETSRKIDI